MYYLLPNPIFNVKNSGADHNIIYESTIISTIYNPFENN